MADESLPGQPSQPDEGTIPTVASTAQTASSLSGWNTLRFALNRLLPRDLTEAQSQQRDILDLLRG
jgi:hypothetical protein